MSNVTDVGAQLLLGNLGRFIPTPKSSVSGFGKVLRTAGDALKSVSSTMVGIDPEYRSLIEKQIEVQTQMQLVSMESNIEKSKHETQMAPIRNIRVG